jgi:hypothetical protein
MNYSLTPPSSESPLGLKLAQAHITLCLIFFYQINRDGEIRTRNRLVIKALISCQRTNSTQKLKLLGEVLGYDLYYSLTLQRNLLQMFFL